MQINLTTELYASTTANATNTQQPQALRKQNNPLPTVTEITVLRPGGHFDLQVEGQIWAHVADAIVHEV